MTSTSPVMLRPPRDTGGGLGSRWRALAEVTAGGFATIEGDTTPARIAGALATLFEGSALMLGRVGNEDAVVVRSRAGSRPAPEAGDECTLALARAAVRERRILRGAAADHETVLAAPLRGRDGPIGALVVTGDDLGGADDTAVLDCFSVHAARALDTGLVESERRHAIGELAAGLAHHLNNLMTVALGNVQLMLRHPLPESGTRSLNAVERAVLDAADVVRRLAASTGEPLVGIQTSLDLNALVDDTLALSRARWHDEAQVRGVAIHARFERGDLPPVIADEAEVREVLLNLILNAVDALGDGGDLVVRTWAEAGRVICAVADTGEGMSADVRRRATEPFFTTRGPGRRGLGLSVAAGIVERHRGGLVIESSEGCGTTVSVHLPAVAAPSVDAPDVVAAIVRGLRILVVDDEDTVRITIAELLGAMGHQAVQAADGDEALALLTTARGDFDAVLTDLGMPGLTGWDVIERVKAAWPALPVVLVTGWGEHPRGGERRHAPDAVLAKPLTESRLREVIAGAVGAAA